MKEIAATAGGFLANLSSLISLMIAHPVVGVKLDLEAWTDKFKILASNHTDGRHGSSTVNAPWQNMQFYKHFQVFVRRSAAKLTNCFLVSVRSEQGL